MRETDDIERLFRTSFDGFEVTPPVSVKTAIDKELKSQKRRLVWWLSALVIVLATIGSSFLFKGVSNEKQRNGKIILAKNTVQQPDPNGRKNEKQEQNRKNQIKNQNSIQNPESNTKVSASTHQSLNAKKSTTENGQNNAAHTSHLKTYSGNTVSSHPSSASNGKVKAKKSSKSKKQVGNPDTKNANEGQNDNHASTLSSVKDAIKDIATENKNPQTIAPVDSVATTQVDSSAVHDSTSTAANTPPSPDNGKPGNENTDKKWLASYYFGPQFDLWKVKEPDSELRLNPSFRTSVEISRKLKSNFAVSAGMGYNQFKESYKTSYVSGIDTVFAGIDSIPIYDQQFPDSIIGYDTVAVYNYNPIVNQSTFTNSTTVFYVPLFISKTFDLSEKWVIMTDLGATFNFYKTRQSVPDPNSPVKSYNAFGINAALRLYGGYKFGSNWMATAGFTYSIYLKTPVVYNGSTTQRMFVSPQLGIHYSF